MYDVLVNNTKRVVVRASQGHKEYSSKRVSSSTSCMDKLVVVIIRYILRARIINNTLVHDMLILAR